jgi:hypothetical protein
MKKTITFAIFLFAMMAADNSSQALHAQGFYFDAGISLGGSWSNLNGKNITNLYTGKDPFWGFTFGISTKAGYGPIANMPLYVVGNLEVIMQDTHSRSKDRDPFEEDPNLSSIFCGYAGIGPGVIFYPVPFIQLAASTGVLAGGGISISGKHFVNTKLPQKDNGDKEDEGYGFILDVSAAIDPIPSGKHGVLAGIKYTGAFVPSMRKSNSNLNSHFLTLFVKYAYRHKRKT